MHPILFEIGTLTIYSYGFALATAFCLSIYLVTKEAKKKQIDPQTTLDISILLLISGIIGGKLAYITLNLSEYIKNPLDPTLWRAGFVFFGGLFMSVIAVLVYTKKKNLPFLKIADLFIPYAALGQAIGRIGCFLNGCCYGKPTILPWGRVFPLICPAGYHYGALKLHPTQLYSSLFLFLLFLSLRKVEANKRFKGEAFLLYLIFYTGFRFFMDFLRGDSSESIFYNLNLFQIICIAIVGTSSVIFFLKAKKDK